MEEIFCVFIGSDHVTYGWFRFDDRGEVLYRKIPAVPILDKFRPVYGNLHDVPFQEYRIYEPGKGVLETPCRIYWCDLPKLEPYYAKLNPSHARRIESMELDNTSLHAQVGQLATEMRSYNNEALMEKKIKDKHKFWVHQLKPPFLPGGGTTFGNKPK